MKSSIVRTLVTLSFSAALSPLALLAQVQYNATIPFAFNVGAQSFAAGDYSVHQLSDGHVLQIQSRKDGTSVMAMVTAGEESSQSGRSVIKFNRYGNRYFLAEVSGERRGWRLFRSKAEKELIAKVAAPEPVVIAADSHSK
jgi:hypothetical protein